MTPAIDAEPPAMVALAHQRRVGLTATFTAPIPGGTTPMPALTYKPAELQPTFPLEMNAHLFPRNRTSVPIDPREGLLLSKEVGEPPLVLFATVFLATKLAMA